MSNTQPSRLAGGLSKPVIGLLGAPGSGKSAVARAFAGLGCGVIDADRLAKAALTRGDVLEALVSWWGRGVLDDGGSIDRTAVGRIVFDRPAELKRLEALTHPIVHAGRQAERMRLDADPSVRAIVEDCPLLLESGLETGCDALVYVEADLATRQARVWEARGWDAEELARRESRQWPLDIKQQAADYVVGNAKGLGDLSQQVGTVLKQVLQSFKLAATD